MSKIDKLPLDAVDLHVEHDCNSTSLHFTSDNRKCVYTYFGVWDIGSTTTDEHFMYVTLKTKTK